MHILGVVLACLVFTIALLPLPAAAQDTAAKPFTPEQLDQIVAPIALHPDALVAQLLMASTYPLEVVQAARFVQANPKLAGEQLNQALQQQTWDDSVKSLATFPQVLSMMNEKLDWLQKLGDAFLAQQQEVLAAIQRLRARAQASGQLKSSAEQNVTVEPAASPATAPSTTVEVVQAAPTVIKIEPTNPEVIYVPSYDPTVVYGAWPPAYPPYSPYPYGAFAAGAFGFMAGVAVGGALWGDCDWNNGDININNERVNHFSNNVNNRQEARNRVEQRSQNRTAGAGGRDGSRWQHNPEHRKGAQYRDKATQQRFDRAGPANAQSREAFRGRAQSGDLGGGAAAQSGVNRAGGREGGFGQQAGGGIGDRGGQASPRTSGAGQGGFGQGGGGGSRAGAFEGVGGGRDAQSFSSRGNASRESFSRSSAGGSRGSSSSFSSGSRGGGGARAGGGGGARGGGGGRGGGGRR